MTVNHTNNATHLIRDATHPKSAQQIKKIDLKPTEQQRIPLGTFTNDNPPKGFSIEITPDPTPEDSVLTEVTRLGTEKQYRLILHIANYSSGSINAIIRKLK